MSTETALSPAGRSLGGRQWKQIALLTLGAIALYTAVRRMPTGTNLNHMDFRVSGTNSIEFCDPANPQFVPVVAVRSPVELSVVTPEPARSGRESHFIASLKTANGKTIAPEDLLVVHTQKLHLLIVDPTLTDYQHVHPQPGATPGEWAFAFVPQRSGVYRVFADFTPSATARGLYAGTEIAVGAGDETASAAVEPPPNAWTYRHDGYEYALRPATEPVRAGQPADLAFSVRRGDGAPVELRPVMDAYAHLVAFDEKRSGFAHLHPAETDLSRRPDERQPRLNFKITIPRAGRYVIWAQVNIAGRERFTPFWFDVEP